MSAQPDPPANSHEPQPSGAARPPRSVLPPPAFHDPKHHIKVYQGDCLEIPARIPPETVDLICADPPYFLSNDGITCHAGRMVSVNKGKWDKSRGPDLDHEFNRAWIDACQRVLKPNGTLWVSGTAHVIHSVGFAMQQLGMKLLNDITWVKPNPPPNLSCRYFTHATETIIWAAKSKKSKHTFNYKLMRQLAGGRQMKSVWAYEAPQSDKFDPADIWEINAPDRTEKIFGKHPTQKPVALLERILLAASNEGDLVLDPFMGGGTTAIASLRLRRAVLAVERDSLWADLAVVRIFAEIVCVRFEALSLGSRLDVRSLFMDRSERRADAADMLPSSKLVHKECKYLFVGLCEREVVYSVVAKSLDEAWAHFQSSTRSSEKILSVIKTETEIYLAQ